MLPVPLDTTVPESAPLSPSRMVTPRAKKAVSWRPYVTNFAIEPVKREDGYDLWWTSEDICSFKSECRMIVRCMNNSEHFSENDDLCTRGLESRTECGSNLRKMRRIQCAFGVLDEQEYQREESIRDENMISEIYINLCGTSSQEARIRALQDQRIALEERTTGSESSSVGFKQAMDTLSASGRQLYTESKLNRVAGQAA